MGGKNPLVVLDDADLNRAVAVALDGAFFGSGQRCTASSRRFVTAGIHDRFVALLGGQVRSLKVGHALDPNVQVGPAASDDQRETVSGSPGIPPAARAKVGTDGQGLTSTPGGRPVERLVRKERDRK